MCQRRQKSQLYSFLWFCVEIDRVPLCVEQAAEEKTFVEGNSSSRASSPEDWLLFLIVQMGIVGNVGDVQ